MDPKDKCLIINDMTPKGGLFAGEKKEVHPESNSVWRISPDPFWIDNQLFVQLEDFGNHLLSFYRACNRLYLQSTRGIQPQWVSEYLDKGKPEFLIEYGKMKRIRTQLPLIIRPDVIFTDDGIIVSELDSVPGGIGFTAGLSQRYGMFDEPIVGGPDGMVRGFGEMICSVSKVEQPNLAIVVSDEADDYWDEMVWLGGHLNNSGLSTYVVKPKDLIFSEDGIFLNVEGEQTKIDVLYRFFELFDLKNIPKWELIMYSAKKRTVVVTPPFKGYLEEKMLFALFHHPVLKSFWINEMGGETYHVLSNVFPRTWILDPRKIPPYAVIPGLSVDGRGVCRWSDLLSWGQRERDFLIKPSGYSELAWGSRGISVGADLSQDDWKEAILNGLSKFEDTPYILQKFHKGKRVQIDYYDFNDSQIKTMDGRVRLCPYYFVIDDSVRLDGILATVCPSDKKLLHGMVDAVMLPAGVKHKRKEETFDAQREVGQPECHLEIDG